MLSFLLAAETGGGQTTQVTDFLTTIDWATPTWDLFIILFFLVSAFLYGLSLGRDRIVVILVSIYMALAVVNTVPEEIVISDFFVFRISTFIGIFVLLFFLLSRSALLKTIAASDTKGSWWQVMVFSILHVGLLISITLSFLPPDGVEILSPLTKQLFVNDIAQFAWIVLPILTMIIIRAGGGEKKFKYDL